MKEIPLYSLVIFPTPEQSEFVKSYKQLLKGKIGWFGSANSAAHITIIQFDNEITFALYIQQIREFCKTIPPKKVTFNSFDAFKPYTFFIAPDENSQKYLDTLIIDVHKHLGLKAEYSHAHLTIARQLDEGKLKIAYDLFKNTKLNFHFVCDAIYVRKFNSTTKQYSDVVEVIKFSDYNF